MPPQAQAIELLCRCDDIPDDGIELRVLKGLLTAATSTTTHLHGQVRLHVSAETSCCIAHGAYGWLWPPAIPPWVPSTRPVTYPTC